MGGFNLKWGREYTGFTLIFEILPFDNRMNRSKSGLHQDWLGIWECIDIINRDGFNENPSLIIFLFLSPYSAKVPQSARWLIESEVALQLT